MPGMGAKLNTSNRTVVAAFEHTLGRQGLVVLLILLFAMIIWNLLRLARLRAGVPNASAPTAKVEPVARHFLRLSFGLLWVFDGLLQSQVSMPLGLPSAVLQPAAANSPSWVQHVDNLAASLWSNHPISAAAAAVWIELGIGIWLLCAPRGWWSRSAGAASAAWALLVWVFGEAFGGVFSPALTWAFGAPGAALFYFVAGALLLADEDAWQRPRLGRRAVRGAGVFLLAMALLQAWPGRGFWQGRTTDGHRLGTLAAMVHQMAATPQPRVLSSLVASFASFDAAHGWAVNAFLVVALGATGAAFLGARPKLVGPALCAAVVLCLADWVLVEDLGFLGGVGTDPNSMIPTALVFTGSYLALVRAPVTLAVAEPSLGPSWRERLANPVYAFRALLGAGALGIVAVGAAPMALAAMNPVADPILTQALNGTPDPTDVPAASFQLVDQYGRTVSLTTLRDRVVTIAFLDPVCTSDCPVIAQELRLADQMLGSSARETLFVGIATNPIYHSIAATRAFDRAEGLNHLQNWLFLSGSLPALEQTWSNYGVQVQVPSAGAMVAHSDLVYLLDKTGHVRFIVNADPGSATTAERSSFAGVIASQLRRILAAS